ncbi:MAG: hypothetical protein LBN38_08650 [Verrucomicrobiota bacterium]|nr:hypothetical protein [Verrucomicrobiota bacterium]
MIRTPALVESAAVMASGSAGIMTTRAGYARVYETGGGGGGLRLGVGRRGLETRWVPSFGRSLPFEVGLS